jgi:hypothetical protein
MRCEDLEPERSVNMRICRSIAVAVGSLLLAGTASAEDAVETWQHTVIVYGMGASIDGTSQIGPLAVPVDVSMSDMFENLKMGGMAAYRADNGTWAFIGDVTYMHLGATQRYANSRKGDADLEQTTLMLNAARRLSPNLEATFGVAYFNINAELELTGPLIGRRSASTNVAWVDPTIGLQWTQPFGERWSFSLRGDVGGFGVGSELLVHALAGLRFQQSAHLGWMVGFRLIDFEYEENEGRGLKYKRFDLQEKGPALGFAYTF